MRKTGWVVAGGLLAACSTDSPPTNQIEPMVASVGGSSSEMKFAFVPESKQARLPEILAGAVPREFRWVMFTLDRADADKLTKPEGLVVDMVQPSVFAFSQVYEDVCNPALMNFNPCWLYEQLGAGATGVRGGISLHVADGTISGSYDVMIEGDTDRFGDPIQWHSHGTTGGVFAKLPDGVDL